MVVRNQKPAKNGKQTLIVMQIQEQTVETVNAGGVLMIPELTAETTNVGVVLMSQE